MPNRIIKESITTSATLATLTDGEERHFWRLLVQADDFGYLDGRPEVIRARAYPLMLDAVSLQESETRTQSLVRVGLLHLFQHKGKRYGHFPTWDSHQQKRAKFSKYPHVQSCEINCLQTIADDSRCKHAIASAPETLDIRNETLEARIEKCETEVSHVPLPEQEGVRAEIPNSCQSWQKLIEQADTQQAQVKILVDMAAHHFAHLPAKPGGFAVALLKQTHDPPYAVKLLWDAFGANPAGNVFTYAAGIYRNRNGRAQRVDPRRLHEQGASTGRAWEVIGESVKDNNCDQAV